MTPKDKVAAGHRVKQLLDDPAVAEMLAGLERSYFEQFVNAPDNQLPLVRNKVAVLRDILAGLRMIVDTGTIAEHALKRSPRT